ncbi:phosphate ABC transporter permease PstA [Tsukamurella pseudospumae]|uniref:Phosphate transport system permease protein PstA n=1 Tax=Tsukamurella pseudospumae TaxID=239498 RepID=A0A138A3P8_9ACTN|nr:phosphate ABC transporter permease PstA [Tsukamurella pseudospumae]KXO98729.1 phosphate ABC transporter permease [Tsukamurella pseudospumae]KXP05050.1 phosphate ABC transporter permease [Tsukamurella pseudospumae]
MTTEDRSPALDSIAKSGTVFHRTSTVRRLKNNAAAIIFGGCFLLALVPLISLLYMVIVNGFPAIIHPEWWTKSMVRVAPDSYAGGISHAIYGTLVQAGIATVFSVPIGVMVGIYLVEYAEGTRLGKVTTFMVDVLAGIPSIVATLFIFGVWITTIGMPQSAFAVSLALILLMVPVVVRSTEEMLKLVPNELREASYALGVPKWKTIVRIVVPTAVSGMVSGVFLAIARVVGETAPVLLLVGISDRRNYDVFNGNMSSLPLFIYDQIRNNPGEVGEYRAWGAALTLVLLVGIASGLAALMSRVLAPKTK